MIIRGYVVGSILGPVVTIPICILLFLFLNPEAGFHLLLFFGFTGCMIPPYVLMYGAFATLFQKRLLPSLILLINFVLLAIFGANCFRNGCLHLFKEGGSGLFPMYFFVLYFLYGQSYSGYLLEIINSYLN